MGSEMCIRDRRLRLALQEFVIEPIPTTLELHKRLIDEPAIVSGDYSIKWLEKEFFKAGG